MQQPKPKRQLKRIVPEERLKELAADGLSVTGWFVLIAGVLGCFSALGSKESVVGGLIVALSGIVIIVGGHIVYRLELIRRLLADQNRDRDESGSDHDA